MDEKETLRRRVRELEAEVAQLTRGRDALVVELFRDAEARVLLQISEDVPLPTILESLVLALERPFEGMLGSILLLDDDGRTLRHGAAPSLPADYNRLVDGLLIGPSVGSCGTAAYRKAPVIVADIATDPLWAPYRGVAETYGFGACWSTPILSSRGRVLGTFAQYYREARSPTAPETAMIERATHVATIAIERTRAKQELRRSAERYRLLLDNVRVIVWEGDCATRTFTFVSEQAEKISGYPPEAWTTFDFWEAHIHPDDRARAIRYCEESSALGEAHEFEYRWLSPGGRVVWIRDIVAVEMADQRPRRLYGIMADITERKQAEETLFQSQRFLGSIAEASPDWIYVFDFDAMATTYRNRSIFRDLDYPPDLQRAESRLETFREIMPPEELPHLARLLEEWRSLPDGRVREDEYRLRHADGSLRCFGGRELVFARRPDGSVRQILGALSDITERRRAEEALRESEANFRGYFDNVAVGAAQINLEGRFVRVNDRYCAITGYSREALTGGMGPLDLDHPDDRAADRDRIRQFLAHELPVYDAQKRYVRKDGEVAWVHVSSTAVCDDTGQLRYTAGIAEDITERKRAEERLRQEKDFSEALIQSLPGLAYLIDGQARILRWNRYVEEVTGYSAAEIAGMHPLDFVVPEERPRVGAEMQLTFERGSNLTETTILTKSGARIPHLFSALRIMRDGASFLLGLGIDITGRKQAEEEVRRLNVELEERVRQRTVQLETANRELEAFSYSISHDLRAPLRAIDGFSEKLLSEFAAQFPPEAVRQLGRVRANTVQMGQLIDDLLAFSRLSRQPLRKRLLAPADIVGQVLADLHGEREGRHVEVRVGPLPPCQGDPALLKQVFANLIGNALKYSRQRDPAVIEVGSRAGDVPRECVYFVKDNGAGFDMRYAGKLFGVFHRLHRAEDYEGTGVGLAIVQRIIQRHGGRVWAEAEIGKGATFYFTVAGGDSAAG